VCQRPTSRIHPTTHHHAHELFDVALGVLALEEGGEVGDEGAVGLWYCVVRFAKRGRIKYK